MIRGRSHPSRHSVEEIMKRLVLVTLLFALALSASAQQSSDQPATKHGRKHHSAAADQMPSTTQSVEMKKMTDTFAGLWKTTATVEASEWFPQAGTAVGRSDFRSGPAGNS